MHKTSSVPCPPERVESSLAFVPYHLVPTSSQSQEVAVLVHLSPAGSLGLSSVYIGDLSLSQAHCYNIFCFTHTAHAQMPPVKTARLAITIWMHEIEVDGLSYFSSSTHNCANVFRLSCSRTQGRNRHCHPSMCTNFPDSLTPRSMPSPLHSTVSPR